MHLQKNSDIMSEKQGDAFLMPRKYSKEEKEEYLKRYYESKQSKLNFVKRLPYLSFLNSVVRNFRTTGFVKK